MVAGAEAESGVAAPAHPVDAHAEIGRGRVGGGAAALAHGQGAAHVVDLLTVVRALPGATGWAVALVGRDRAEVEVARRVAGRAHVSKRRIWEVPGSTGRHHGVIRGSLGSH